MYEAFFGFSQRPFASVPRVDQYFPGTAIEGARQTLARCVQRGEGVGMLVGPSGTGKTLLCRVLAEQFKDSFEVALLSSGRLGTRRAMLQAVLYELGQPYRGMDEGEARLALTDHLAFGEDRPSGLVLLVDEAHALPVRLLDEVRMLTNLVHDGQPRVRLVLAGGPVLEERFASPKLESFSQRLVGRCYLESFNRTETESYVYAQIDRVGGEGEAVFPREVCQAVYQATDGVPRLINQLCDHALLLAYAGGRQQLDAAAVEEAWADLQQLPTPWNADTPGDGPQEGVVEFGGLVDEPSEDEMTGEMEAKLPRLRVTSDSDEPIPEPAEQLERIEATLADLDDEEFRPAGSIVPEVELVFDDPENPFDEEFQEEEVISDRFVAVDRSRWGEQPQVLRHRGQPDPQPVTSDLDGLKASIEAIGLSAGAIESRPQPETFPLRRQSPQRAAEPEEALEPEEKDIIVVEDGYVEHDLPRAGVCTAVGRQEYRQLFAKLRRG